MTQIKSLFKHNSWNDWTLLALIALSVSFVKLMPFGLIVLALIGWRNRNAGLESRKRLFHLNQVEFWLIVFYLFHFVGMLWTENRAFGWSDIGMKASFLILPIVFSLFAFTLDQRKLVNAFLFSVLLIYGIYTGNAIYKSFADYHDNHYAYFFASEFTAFMHRSYFATYTSLAACLSLIYWNFHKRNGFYVFTFILSCFATVQTESKAGTIILFLGIVIYTIHYVLTIKMYKLGLAAFILLASSIGFIFLSNSNIASRFQEIPKAFAHIKTENNPIVESNTDRIIMWATSIKVIKENPLLGTGTGDVKDELLKKNLALNNTGVARLNLNAHNQFLNTAVQLGMVAFLVLITIFFTIFRKAYKEKNTVLFFIGFVFMISMLFESFVESQQGIMPFCLLVVAFFNVRPALQAD